MIEHVDVVVIGAGISDIGAGYHLRTPCPDRSSPILEVRADVPARSAAPVPAER